MKNIFNEFFILLHNFLDEYDNIIYIKNIICLSKKFKDILFKFNNIKIIWLKNNQLNKIKELNYNNCILLTINILIYPHQKKQLFNTQEYININNLITNNNYIKLLNNYYNIKKLYFGDKIYYEYKYNYIINIYNINYIIKLLNNKIYNYIIYNYNKNNNIITYIYCYNNNIKIYDNKNNQIKYLFKKYIN
jgi:hypothetical protein